MAERSASRKSPKTGPSTAEVVKKPVLLKLAGMGRGQTVLESKLNGDAFEDIFVNRARTNGLLPDKNFLTAKYIPGRRPLIVKSELDFKLISKQGQVGYFDCKNFAGAYFVYSELRESQVKKAVMFNQWNVPAGFVVWLRALNVVTFYSGHCIASRGPRTRFGPQDGQILGAIQTFDLRPILTPISLPFELVSQGIS